MQRQPVRQPRGDQVLDDLLLAVDRDRAAAGELGQRDPVPRAAEAQLDALVHEPLAVQPVGHAQLGEQIDRALLEHAGAHAPLDVLARAVLEHDRVDPARVQQRPEHEPRWPGADDRDLRPHAA